MEELKSVAFRIPGYHNRELIVWALVDSGYQVRVDKRPIGIMKDQEHWIIVSGFGSIEFSKEE
jgi:hypothetical protein